MTMSCLFACLCVCLFANLGVHSYRIAVITLPLYGHFRPLKAVAEQLAVSGHHVDVYVPDTAWCGPRLPHCHAVPTFGTFNDTLWARLSALPTVWGTFPDLFEETLLHHELSLPYYMQHFETEYSRNVSTTLQLILMDQTTFVGHALSARSGVPYVSVYPFTLMLNIGCQVWMPSMGTGFPLAMTFHQRYLNHLSYAAALLFGPLVLCRLNNVRETHGIAPYRNIFEPAGLLSVVITPSIFGFDIPQPLCPNVKPCGLLLPDSTHEAPLGDVVQAFLDRCEGPLGLPVLYVNLGTLVVLTATQEETLRTALDGLRSSMCVVWKVRHSQRHAAFSSLSSTPSVAEVENGTLLTSTRFPSVVALLRHKATRVFLTHCGDTSVAEAIEANVPMVGLPFFADQGDVCARVVESRIGVSLSHKSSFTSTEVERSVRAVLNNYDMYRSNMERLRTTSVLSGESRCASEHVVHAIEYGVDGDVCQYLNTAYFYEVMEWDVLVVDGLSVVVTVLLMKFMWSLSARAVGLRY